MPAKAKLRDLERLAIDEAKEKGCPPEYIAWWKKWQKDQKRESAYVAHRRDNPKFKQIRDRVTALFFRYAALHRQDDPDVKDRVLNLWTYAMVYCLPISSVEQIEEIVREISLNDKHYGMPAYDTILSHFPNVPHAIWWTEDWKKAWSGEGPVPNSEWAHR